MTALYLHSMSKTKIEFPNEILKTLKDKWKFCCLVNHNGVDIIDMQNAY